MKKTLLELQQHLFSTRRYIQRREGVESVEAVGKQPTWVVGRACSIYRSVNFDHVPAAKQQQALEQKIPIISPFGHSAYWVDWQKGRAHIWLWDKSIQDELVEGQENLKPDTLDFVPESAFTDKKVEGPSLWETENGFIGQHWQDSTIVGEHWWPSAPTEAQWAAFMKSISVSSILMPESKELIIDGSTTRWKNSQHGQFVSPTIERSTMVSVATLLVLILVFQLSGIVRLNWHISDLSEGIKLIEPSVEKTVSLRDRFFQLRAQNREYLASEGKAQIQMMAEISDVLAIFNAQILNWSFQEGGLEMIIEDANPRLSLYVEQFEALGWMSDIRIDRRGNNTEITVKAELLGGSWSQ